MIPAFAGALGYVKSTNGSFRDSTSSDAFFGNFKAPPRALICVKVPGWDGHSITQSAPTESLFK